MISRFFRYCEKVFKLSTVVQKVEERRPRPQIRGRAVWLSIFLLFALRLGSLNALEQMLRDAQRRGKWRRVLGDVAPSADTIGYFAERVSLDSLRWVLQDIYHRLQRNHQVAKLRLGGYVVLVLDGHELFASYRRHCPRCLKRTVTTARGPRIQYYHRIAVAHLAAGLIPIILDAEEQRPGEDEVAAARRLLERVQARYPKAYDVVTADALYADYKVVSFLRSHNKHLVVTLKENHADLLADARGLFAKMTPAKQVIGQQEFLRWDVEGFSSWCSIEQEVRVVRSLETKPRDGERVSSDWYWATTLPQKEAPTTTVCHIGHARWDIDNDVFNYLCTYYNFDHPFHHHPNAIMTFVLTACIVYVLECAFYHLNLKPALRYSCCLNSLITRFLITLDHFLAEAKRSKPIRALT